MYQIASLQNLSKTNKPHQTGIFVSDVLAVSDIYTALDSP